MNFLITYAVNHLLNAGLVSIDEQTTWEEEDIAFLDGLDEKELPRA